MCERPTGGVEGSYGFGPVFGCFVSGPKGVRFIGFLSISFEREN